MEQEYILRLYDTDLLTFSLSEHGLEGLKAKIHEVNQKKLSCLPLDMELRAYPKIIRTHLACRFSATLRCFPLPYDSMPAEKRLDPLEI